jgi:glycosyltransferase involved in cell wall biosynthesis
LTDALVAQAYYDTYKFSHDANTKVSAAPPKILFLVSHLSSGGAQEIMADLAAGLTTRGFEVELRALYPISHSPPADGRVQWVCILDKKPNSILGMLRLLWAMLRALRQSRPCAIISGMPAANVAAVLASKLSAVNSRLIITHHSPIETHNAAINFFDGWLGGSRIVTAVVCVSNVVAASLHKKSGAYLAKRRTIHNALPPHIEELLSELASRRNNRGAASRTIVATGRLTQQKNYPVLLRAAVHLADVNIQIIGGGEDEIELKALARTIGVSNRVHFLGRRTREDTLNLLAAGDIFVQPSLFEGHSLALIEAAKLNLPLVVSDLPVQAESVTTSDGTLCGLMVDPNDDRALAHEISRLLDDPDYYSEWVARSRRLGESIHFDAMLDAYEELLH